MRRGRAEECRSELVSDDHPMSLAGDLKIKGAFGPGVSVASVKNSILVKARRDVIVQAAVEVFFEKGYHVSRVLDVAKARNISAVMKKSLALQLQQRPRLEKNWMLYFAQQSKSFSNTASILL